MREEWVQSDIVELTMLYKKNILLNLFTWYLKIYFTFIEGNKICVTFNTNTGFIVFTDDRWC